MKMPKPKDKAFWLIIIVYVLILAGTYKLGTNDIEKRQMVHDARAVLETPNLTEGMCPSGWEPLPPVEPALLQP